MPISYIRTHDLSDLSAVTCYAVYRSKHDLFSDLEKEYFPQRDSYALYFYPALEIESIAQLNVIEWINNGHRVHAVQLTQKIRFDHKLLFEPVKVGVKPNSYNNIKLTIFSLANFLELTDEIMSDDKYFFLRRLMRLLPLDFLHPTQKRFEIVYDLRDNTAFITLLNSHWQLSSLLLNRVTLHLPEQRFAMMQSVLGQFCYLNTVRRCLIPTQCRFQLPQNMQQDLVLTALIKIKNISEPSLAVAFPTSTVRSLNKSMSEERLIDSSYIPINFMCPLSGEFFNEPLRITDKGNQVRYHHFESSFLIELLKQKAVNPYNNEPLSVAEVKIKLTDYEMQRSVKVFKIHLLQEGKAITRDIHAPEIMTSAPSHHVQDKLPVPSSALIQKVAQSPVFTNPDQQSPVVPLVIAAASGTRSQSSEASAAAAMRRK